MIKNIIFSTLAKSSMLLNVPLSKMQKKQIEDRYYQNKLISDTIPNDYINGQGLKPVSECTFGIIGNVKKNGCGAIAVYNVLYYLKNKDEVVDLAKIIRLFDIYYGLSLGGMLGSNIEVLAKTLKSQKVINKVIYIPKNIDKIITNSLISIVMITTKLGAHYITVRYDRQEQVFLIYNYYSNRKTVLKVTSLDELFMNNKHFIIGCIIIK